MTAAPAGVLRGTLSARFPLRFAALGHKQVYIFAGFRSLTKMRQHYRSEKLPNKRVIRNRHFLKFPKRQRHDSMVLAINSAG